MLQQLQTANGKYHAADTDHAGEIDPDEFLKVVQNLSSVLLELEEYDDALAVLGDALNVTSLKAAKEAEINELIVTVAFGKANALTNSGGNPDDIIGVANIGLAKANDEGLHFLKARAHLEKRELAEAIDEFAHVKDSTAVQIADYANKTAKALIIDMAIDAIQRGTLFTTIIAGDGIGNSADDWITARELADNIASYARFKFTPTPAQVIEGAVPDKSLGCILMNAVIGQHPDATDTLHAMVTGKVDSTVLGQIEAAVDPIDGVDFSALVWA